MPSKSNECSICMEVPKFSTVETNCGHTFCFECYSKHVNSGQNYSHKCPYCRKAISETGDELIRREEYLRNLPAPEPTTELNNSWEIFPSEDNNASPALNNRIMDAMYIAQHIRNINGEERGNFIRRIHNSDHEERRVIAQNIRNSNQTLNVSQPVRTPFLPNNSIIQRTPSNVRRIIPPKYNLYPGYQGCWNNKGHPDKRTKEWHEWERQNAN